MNNSKLENVYQLNGKLPVSVAIPFGLQHILAMFVSNITPIMIICGLAQVNGNHLQMIHT